MDKDQRQISIRLNGKEQAYKELEPFEEEQVAATSEEDELLPAKEPEKKTPKIIDFGKKRRERTKEEPPFWDDGNREQGPKLPYKRKKKRRPRLGISLKALPMSMIIAFVSAIIIGISFGFMVLTVFTNDRTATTTPPTQNAQVAEMNTTSNNTASVPVATEHVTVPALSVEVVQGGAFSTRDKGQESVNMIQQAGYAATLTTSSDPFFMFIGLGVDREQADRIGDLYKERGQETFIKPLTVEEVQVATSNPEHVHFLIHGGELFKDLVSISVNGLTEGSLSLSDERLVAIVDKHERLKVEQQNFSDHFEQSGELALAFIGSISSALDQMKEVQTRDQLWKVQQYLLDGLIAYESLINKVSSNG